MVWACRYVFPLPPPLAHSLTSVQIPEIGTLLFTTQLIVAFTLIFLAGPFTKRASIRQVAIISSIGFVLLAAYLPIAAHLGSHWAFKSSWLVGQAVAELWIPSVSPLGHAQGSYLVLICQEARSDVTRTLPRLERQGICDGRQQAMRHCGRSRRHGGLWVSTSPFGSYRATLR